MNKYEIIGNLVRDPEIGTTEGGVHYTVFTVAARRRFHKDGEPDAEFVRVTAWRGLGDLCAKYLEKGKKVYAAGEPRAHAWKTEDGSVRGQIEMNANEVEVLSGRPGQAAEGPEDFPKEEEKPF